MSDNNIDNRHLIDLMNNLKEENTPENQKALINGIMASTVYVPKMKQSVGGDELMLPAVIKTQDGKVFMPVFTDKAYLDEKTRSLDISPIPFSQVATIVVKQNEANAEREDTNSFTGVVINPMYHAIVVSAAMLSDIVSKMHPVKMTEEQYITFERCRFEQNIIPELFFAKDEEFVKALMVGKDKLLCDMSEKAYTLQRVNPYVPDDFAVDIMNYYEDTCVVKLDMPEKHHYVGTAECIIMVLKKDSDFRRFFVIVKEPGEGDNTGRGLIEVHADKSINRIGDAPDTGTEIYWILNEIV